MIDCTGYEKELVRLLAGEMKAAERTSLLQDLRRHAEVCAACSADVTLLEWAADREGPLDPDEDPGEAYWESFESRLEGKLDAPGKPKPSRHSVRPPWLLIAATLVFGLIGTALIVDSLRQPPEQVATQPNAPIEVPELESLLADATVAQEQFQQQLEESGEIELEGELGSLEALEQDAEMAVQTAGWIPDVSALDEAAQLEMLRWLEERI